MNAHRGRKRHASCPGLAAGSQSEHSRYDNRRVDRPALAKAQLLSISRTDVEQAVLAGHERRSRNTGAVDWLLRSRRLAIAYNYPGDDDLTASVVTLRTAR